MTTKWQEEYDVVVVGSGGAGMTAAVVAANEGLKVVVLEKESVWGGTTAISGGGLWIPNSPHHVAAGVDDSFDKALQYLGETVGEQTAREKQMAFLKQGPEMVRYMESHTSLKFEPYESYPDYYPNLPGGMPDGRGLEAKPVNARALGDDFFTLKPPLPVTMILGGMMVGKSDLNKMLSCMNSWSSLFYTSKRMLAHLADIKGRQYYGRGTHLINGNALASRLYISLKDLKVPVRLNSQVKSLIGEHNQLTGVCALIDGREMNIRARRGVVLACGGFPGSSAMRTAWLPQPSTPLWSAAPNGNTGDGITMGCHLGAAVAGKGNAWWMPTSLLRSKNGEIQRFPHVMDRSKPGVIAVDKQGKRFVNEAVSYLDFVKAMYRQNQNGSTIPAFLIADSHVMNRFGLGFALPFLASKKQLIKAGYLFRGETMEELAEKLGIDAEGLQQTTTTYNGYARDGVDKDFGKGNTEYDRHFGWQGSWPNPCMRPLEKGPFYAIKIYPGDIGTSGGLQTNENSQVLNTSGEVIEGLYAAGNDSASVMGDTYPGPGSTLGPALTFGYVAGLHIAR